MSQKFQIIGISGKAGSGKDYITKNIFPPDYWQFSLAWHFKVWLVGKGLATHEEVFITKPPHVRNLLQEEGTERGRMLYGDDVWCQTALEWFNVIADNWNITKFIIPDVRFPNELKFIRGLGGTVFRIHAPKRVAKSNLTLEARMHISETALDETPPNEYDGIIYNDPEHQETVKRQVYDLLGLHLSGSYETFDESEEDAFLKRVYNWVRFYV